MNIQKLYRGYYLLRIGTLYLTFAYYGRWSRPFVAHCIMADYDRDCVGRSIVFCLGLVSFSVGWANHRLPSAWAEAHHMYSISQDNERLWA